MCLPAAPVVTNAADRQPHMGFCACSQLLQRNNPWFHGKPPPVFRSAESPPFRTASWRHEDCCASPDKAADSPPLLPSLPLLSSVLLPCPPLAQKRPDTISGSPRKPENPQTPLRRRLRSPVLLHSAQRNKRVFPVRLYRMRSNDRAAGQLTPADRTHCFRPVPTASAVCPQAAVYPDGSPRTAGAGSRARPRADTPFSPRPPAARPASSAPARG